MNIIENYIRANLPRLRKVQENQCHPSLIKTGQATYRWNTEQPSWFAIVEELPKYRNSQNTKILFYNERNEFVASTIIDKNGNLKNFNLPMFMR